MKRLHKSASVCLVVCACGGASSGDTTGVARGEGHDAPNAVAPSESEQAGGSSAPTDGPSRVIAELAQLPRLDPGESSRLAPNCTVPTSVGLSAATSGARAARLVWDQETGECELSDVDRSPDGMLGILTLRLKEDKAVISSVGKWKFYAPPELNLEDVPPGQPFTIYPYLGDWQFVATLEHNTEMLELVEFSYIRGVGPTAGGARDDLEDKAPSDFVPPTLCAPNPTDQEAP